MATLDDQLQAMRNLSENWDGYGAAPPQTHVIELAREFVLPRRDFGDEYWLGTGRQ